MKSLPTLDSHAHLSSDRPPEILDSTGSVLAMTLSLAEAEHAFNHRRPNIAWGVGCHPRFQEAQAAFSVDTFRELVGRTAIVGEIGLDTGSRVPMVVQLKNFRATLGVVASQPRLVSIHSYRATGLVLAELRRIPVSTPVLHWWTGSAAQTSEAVELGCYFSIHSAVARHSKFYTRLPPERILLESDHSYSDPPAAIPCRIEWVEHLVAQRLGIDVLEVRKLSWRNFARIIQDNGTTDLLPGLFVQILADVI
jgi:TatD DNase family protein